MKSSYAAFKFFIRWFAVPICLLAGAIESLSCGFDLMSQPSDLAVLGGVCVVAFTVFALAYVTTHYGK